MCGVQARMATRGVVKTVNAGWGSSALLAKMCLVCPFCWAGMGFKKTTNAAIVKANTFY